MHPESSMAEAHRLQSSGNVLNNPGCFFKETGLRKSWLKEIIRGI
jgi:hypothetical protein